MARVSLLVIAGMIGMSAVLGAQTIQVDRNNRTIAVTASDKASLDADVAVVTVGFQIYSPDAATADSQGSKVSNAILDALKKAGVADKAVESQDQKLNYAEFSPDEKSTPEQRAQKAFTLSQSWTVHVGAADAAQVLHVAVEAGANQSGNIEWDLADRNGLQAKAAEKALVRARQVATQMAAGLNARLGQLIYASNQTPVNRFFSGILNTESASIASRPFPPSPPPLAIRPQQVEESATVYAVFAIE
ncbi:MAG TPA: SIMPL domain-containing protein [Acidobacteriaceae bacterium]|nr:SIMPL domain-containing protein [Acidobacteriaceae bacterium]